MKNGKKPNARDRYREQVSAAMPDVKRLVKRFGRKAVANCLHKIQEYDREVGRLAALKKEIAAREARLR